MKRKQHNNLNESVRQVVNEAGAIAAMGVKAAAMGAKAMKALKGAAGAAGVRRRGLSPVSRITRRIFHPVRGLSHRVARSRLAAGDRQRKSAIKRAAGRVITSVRDREIERQTGKVMKRIRRDERGVRRERERREMQDKLDLILQDMRRAKRNK